MSVGSMVDRERERLRRAELAAGAVRVRDSERPWSATVAGIGAMLETAANG